MNLENKHLKSGFKVPRDYFESQKEIVEQLAILSGSESNFTLPDDYFEDASQKLHQLIPKKPKAQLKQWVGYAASIAACFFLAFFLENQNLNLNSEKVLDQYFLEQNSPLTTHELFDLNAIETSEFDAIVFENMNFETIFELQQAYDSNFNILYEDYED